MKQYCDSAHEQGLLRLALALRREQPLHHQLVGAVAGHGEECTADDAGPERVRRRYRERKIKDAEFLRGDRVHSAQPAGNLVQQRGKRDQRALGDAARDGEHRLHLVVVREGAVGVRDQDPST